MQEYYIKSTKYSIRERQTKKGGKVYDVLFRIVDKNTLYETRKCLSGYKTKTAAKEAYTDFVTAYCELWSGNPLKNKKRAANNAAPVISELVKIYFGSLKNQLKDATIYEKQKIFDLIILPAFKDKKITDLTVQELYKWQDDLWSKKNEKTGEYYSYKYLSKIRAYFSAFLSWCAVRYEGAENNLLKVAKPKRRAPQTQMQFWTREEFEQFIAIVDNPLYRCLFSMLFFTGRRKGEILSLTPKDIDLEKSAITFNKSITRKTLDGKPYNITSTKTEITTATPICDPLKTELLSYNGDSPFFFGGNAPVSDQTLRRAFNLYADKAGVKRIRIHDLRHSFVSMCIHLGATIPVVADLIGDTIAQVTKTYAHMYEEDKREIIRKIK